MRLWWTAITSRTPRCCSRARATHPTTNRRWPWRWWKGKPESPRLSGSAQTWFSPSPLTWIRPKARYELPADCCVRTKRQNLRPRRPPQPRSWQRRPCLRLQSQRRKPPGQLCPLLMRPHRLRLWLRAQRPVSQLQDRRRSQGLWPLFPPRSLQPMRSLWR